MGYEAMGLVQESHKMHHAESHSSSDMQVNDSLRFLLLTIMNQMKYVSNFLLKD